MDDITRVGMRLPLTEFNKLIKQVNALIRRYGPPTEPGSILAIESLSFDSGRLAVTVSYASRPDAVAGFAGESTAAKVKGE